MNKKKRLVRRKHKKAIEKLRSRRKAMLERKKQV